MSAQPARADETPAPVARRRPAVPVADVDLRQALVWLDFILGWPGGFLELRLHHPAGERESIWVRGGGHDLARYVLLAEQLNADVECSMLRPQRGWGTGKAVGSLWVRVEGKKQAGALRSFRPVPTFVVREGSSTRYVAFWALERPLRGFEDVLRANKRLAHALGAKKLHADPDEFYFAPPGSVLRRGRSRPCPVVVARAGIETYSARAVVGHLREAPDPEAWRNAPGNTNGERY